MNCKDAWKKPDVPKEQPEMNTVNVGLIATDVITWNSHLRLLHTFVQNEQKNCSATDAWQCGCPLQLVTTIFNIEKSQIFTE